MTTRLYARVSTHDKGQDPETQMRLLRQANGPDSVEYVEHASAVGTRRVWTRLLEEAHSGDTVVVWRLDRAFRSLSDAALTMDELTRRQIGFRSLTEAIDTNTPTGRLLYGILASVAAFERDLLIERVRSGIARSKAQGVTWGWRRGRKRQGVRGKAVD